MRKFEIGKRYSEGGMTIEVVSRTEKTITFAVVLHAGCANEKVRETKKKRIQNFGKGEAIWMSPYEIEA